MLLTFMYHETFPSEVVMPKYIIKPSSLYNACVTMSILDLKTMDCTFSEHEVPGNAEVRILLQIIPSVTNTNSC